jgi:hypothetical protein
MKFRLCILFLEHGLASMPSTPSRDRTTVLYFQTPYYGHAFVNGTQLSNLPCWDFEFRPELRVFA